MTGYDGCNVFHRFANSVRPALVSNEGGPMETVDDGNTGIVLPATNPTVWAQAMNDLLNDEPRRKRMAAAAPPRMARYSLAKTFDAFWAAHVAAVEPVEEKQRADQTPLAV